MALTEQKRARLEKLSDEKGIISALAFDQRGALKRLMAQHQTEEPTVAQMEELKVLVADELTKYASSMSNWVNLLTDIVTNAILDQFTIRSVDTKLDLCWRDVAFWVTTSHLF